MSEAAIGGYEAAAEVLRPRYDAIDPALLYGAVMTHFPQKPSRILDIGAGTGRDAAWLALRCLAILYARRVANVAL